MASPVHNQPLPYYYSQAPPSSHSPRHHSHSHSHSHSQSQSSTPFTTASSVHSPQHQITHTHPGPPAIGYPPFNPYSDHPTPNHPQSYSNTAYHPSVAYDGYAVGLTTHNALQLQPPPPPPIDTSVAYHPSLPSAGAGSHTAYIHRPSPLHHSHSHSQSQSLIPPALHQMSGRGQPASTAHPQTEQTRGGMNTLPPIGNGPSGVNVGPSTTPAKTQSQSSVPALATTATTAAAPPVGADGQPVRKRPKYTRSKAGCLVCRQKKVKCDEKKPVCTRCMHGHRQCSWPKDVPASPTNKNKAAKSVRGVERDLSDADFRNDYGDVDEDDDLPQSADPTATSFSPIQPLSAVSSYAGEIPTSASTSGSFGAPGASYSYSYGAQGALDPSQALSRNSSSRSSEVGYVIGAPEAGPEPLAPYFRTGQERNLVGFESVSYSEPLASVPSLSTSLSPLSLSHSSRHCVPSWSLAPPRISFDRCSSSPSLSPCSSSSFDTSSLLPSPTSSFAAPSQSSLGLSVAGMSPTSSQIRSSSRPLYEAPQPSYLPATGLEWLRLEDFPAGSTVGYQ